MVYDWVEDELLARWKVGDENCFFSGLSSYSSANSPSFAKCAATKVLSDFVPFSDLGSSQATRLLRSSLPVWKIGVALSCGGERRLLSDPLWVSSLEKPLGTSGGRVCPPCTSSKPRGRRRRRGMWARTATSSWSMVSQLCLSSVHTPLLKLYSVA